MSHGGFRVGHRPGDVTFVLFQPLALGAGVTWRTITGGVVSVGGGGAMTWRINVVEVLSSSFAPLEFGLDTWRSCQRLELRAME